MNTGGLQKYLCVLFVPYFKRFAWLAEHNERRSYLRLESFSFQSPYQFRCRPSGIPGDSFKLLVILRARTFFHETRSAKGDLQPVFYRRFADELVRLKVERSRSPLDQRSPSFQKRD